MIAEHPAPRAPMGRDVLARRQDRKETCGEAGNAVEQGGRLRAPPAIRFRTEPVGQEKEGLPTVVVADRRLVDGNVLEIRQLLPVVEDIVELLLHLGHHRFDPADPREGLGREERRRWDGRVLEHPSFRAVQNPGSRFGGHRDRPVPQSCRPRGGRVRRCRHTTAG